MLQHPPILILILMTVSLLGDATAQTHLHERLVKQFSKPWNIRQNEITAIDSQLHSLPDIPLSMLGGTSGLLYVYNSPDEDECIIDVRWEHSERIDLVTLIPARNFDNAGIHPEFALPESFTIELLNADGKPISTVADESHTNERPIQRGFPFCYELPAPIQAHGARIRCSATKYTYFNGNSARLAAWAELFCFSAHRNVAEGSAVWLNGKPSYHLRRNWNINYLTDGITPLGLPETVIETLSEIGWISGSPKEKDHAFAEIEFSALKPINGIRMFPVEHTLLEPVPGFGLPQQFQLLAMDDPNHARILLDQTGADLPNPGHNPFTFRFPETRARRLRVDCSKVWKSHPNDLAFLGFSEIQLLHGETNVALGAMVSVSDNPGRIAARGEQFWNEQSLTDGFGPMGKLISRREWLLQLNRRLELETRQLQLQHEADSIMEIWRHTLYRSAGAITVFALLGLIVLPIRYRIREHRQLQKLRRRIADDLHDEVGANLGSIAYSSELAQEISTDASPKHQELLSDIANTARKTAGETRLLIKFLENKGIEGCLITQFNITANQMLGGIPFKHRYENEEAFNQLPPIIKWDLLLFFKEALHNIVKHAAASQVEITAGASRKQLHLTIRDNGRGLAGDQQPEHLMTRAAKIGAKLKIHSPLGEGTEIQLTMPRKRIPKWTRPSTS
jgi:signal transduction histidine kinase